MNIPSAQQLIGGLKAAALTTIVEPEAAKSEGRQAWQRYVASGGLDETIAKLLCEHSLELTKGADALSQPAEPKHAFMPNSATKLARGAQNAFVAGFAEESQKMGITTGKVIFYGGDGQIGAPLAYKSLDLGTPFTSALKSLLAGEPPASEFLDEATFKKTVQIGEQLIEQAVSAAATAKENELAKARAQGKLDNISLDVDVVIDGRFPDRGDMQKLTYSTLAGLMQVKQNLVDQGYDLKSFATAPRTGHYRDHVLARVVFQLAGPV